MCIVSNVMDGYNPFIPVWPQPGTTPWVPPGDSTAPVPISPPQPIRFEDFTPAYWDKLLRTFQEAMDAAKKADKLTGQPDCSDPEKLKLLERVERLEEELKKIKKEKEKKRRKKAAKIKRAVTKHFKKVGTEFEKRTRIGRPEKPAHSDDL